MTADDVTIAGRWRSLPSSRSAASSTVVVGDVPLGEDDDRRAARPAGLVGHPQIALDDALGRVDQDQRDVGPLGGGQRAHLAVVLDPLAVAALAAQAGGVDQAEVALAAHERACRSRRGSCPAARTRSRAAGRGWRSGATTCPRWGGRGSRRRSRRRRRPPAGRRPRPRPAARRSRPAGRPCRGREGPRPGSGRPAPGCAARAPPASWAASSILFATTITGRPERRRIWAISSSPAARPARASITTATTSASSTARRAWAATWACIGESSPTSRPPVSMSTNVRPRHSQVISLRSRVTPGRSSTTACRDDVSRFTSVDLPALGNPTTATTPMRSSAVLIPPARTGRGSRPSARPRSRGRPAPPAARRARTCAAGRSGCARAGPGASLRCRGSADRDDRRRPRRRRSGRRRPWRPRARPGGAPG